MWVSGSSGTARAKAGSPTTGFITGITCWELFFGLFVLTWVASGLISMNPWGFLEGGGFDEPQRLRGPASSLKDIEASFTALARSPLETGIVSVETTPLRGHLYLIGTRADGTRFRVDSKAMPAVLANTDLQTIAQTLDFHHDGYSLDRIDREDAYYFSHHRARAVLPAYRVIVNDDGRTRYYLDPVSGEIRAKLDRDGRWYRWLHQALHRWDFTAVLRSGLGRVDADSAERRYRGVFVRDLPRSAKPYPQQWLGTLVGTI